MKKILFSLLFVLFAVCSYANDSECTVVTGVKAVLRHTSISVSQNTYQNQVWVEIKKTDPDAVIPDDIFVLVDIKDFDGKVVDTVRVHLGGYMASYALVSGNVEPGLYLLSMKQAICR